jgi:tetratricopeptide (TPR) repeat protein
MKQRTLIHALAAAGLLLGTGFASPPQPSRAEHFDPVLEPGGLCAPPAGRAVAERLLLAKTETTPFRPVPSKPVLDEVPRLYGNLGRLHFPVKTTVARAQHFFDQGLKLSFGFNHAEAIRAFREAQRLDPYCAMCSWGEALALGPNINVPMMPEAVAPAMAAIAKAQALATMAPAKERALIAALAARYSDDPKADRAALDRAYAEAMREVAKLFPRDNNIKVLWAEAMMDTQPWDYWEAAGAKPKGNAADIVAALEEVLRRDPAHMGAAHLYIHAVEASTRPERALPAARRLENLSPGSGHLVHMPAHIYYRLGMYRESLELNKRAIAADERYFETSPSDPLYRSAYYPHNIHFVMVSAQMGGDGATALAAAAKLDASIPNEVAMKIGALEPVKAAPYWAHAQFSTPSAVLALPAPPKELVLVAAFHRYARAVAQASLGEMREAQLELEALSRIEREADFKPFDAWQVPAKDVVRTARLVAEGRIADARGDLEGAARAYEAAIAIEDSLAYMEPAYWYYPVRQSLGSVRLRQGRLEEAERAFRDSLARVRNNGWALAGLAETYARMGNPKAERATRAALARAWLGGNAGPDVARL